MRTRVTIYDSNNYVRVKSETALSGLFMRSILSEANNVDGLVIYVFDGANANAWRRELYPQYKATRKAPLDNFYENLKWFYDLLGYCANNVARVKVEGYEGDDVIATLCERFSEADITVFTTDKDLTRIEGPKFPMANTDWEDRRFVFTRKVLCGDPSDNITGVKGFGETTWKSLSDELKEYARQWVEFGSGEAKEIFADNLPTRAKNAILGAKDEEIETLKKVVGFRIVPDDRLKLDWGTNRKDKIEEELREFE